MTHEISGKTRSTSRKATAKHPAPAGQRRQPRLRKGRAVASTPPNHGDGASVPKRKKAFVL